MKKEREKETAAIADFIYESGLLAKTPRSFTWFLGSGRQSVAEHTLRTAFIGYTLCQMTSEVDEHKVVMQGLFHDLGEARTSDLNYIHQRYGRLAEDQAVADMAASVSFGPKIKAFFDEAMARETSEAKLGKDADQLELLATLREEEVKGNTKAKSWIPSVVARLRTDAGKKLADALIEIHPDHWWFNESDKWFVDREDKHRAWKKK